MRPRTRDGCLSIGPMRINLSIPADLKQSMATVPGRVNWSAIAARAFRQQLDHLSARAPLEPIDSAAAEAGKSWASRVADHAELQRLDVFTRDPNTNWQSCDGGDPGFAAEHFFFAIEPESAGNRAAAVEFWETVTGKPNLPDDAYVRGFASGAIDGWSDFRIAPTG